MPNITRYIQSDILKSCLFIHLFFVPKQYSSSKFREVSITSTLMSGSLAAGCINYLAIKSLVNLS